MVIFDQNFIFIYVPQTVLICKVPRGFSKIFFLLKKCFVQQKKILGIFPNFDK